MRNYLAHHEWALMAVGMIIVFALVIRWVHKADRKAALPYNLKPNEYSFVLYQKCTNIEKTTYTFQADSPEEAREAWLKYWFGKGYVLKVDRDERVSGNSFARYEGCNFMTESEAAALAREITAHGTPEDRIRFESYSKEAASC